MPRKIPDLTLKIREKGKRKNTIIQIFKYPRNINSMKINGKWWKNGLRFKSEKLLDILTNTFEKAMEK